MGEVALFVEAPTLGHQGVNALGAAQRRLNRMLRRHVRAQAHGRQHVEPLNVVRGAVLGAAHHHPTGAEAGRAIGFGETVEGDGQHIRGNGAGGDVLNAVVDDLGVDLVREHHEVFPFRPAHHLLDASAIVNGAGGVVRVDEHQRLCAAGGEGAEVVQIRHPTGAFVATVVARHTAGHAHGGRPQRIIRRRQEHFVAGVQKRLHGHDDEFADAVADIHVVHIHTGNVQPLAVLHDGLARRIQPLGMFIALARRQVVYHVAHDLFRRLEVERRRIADVELQDAVPFLLQAVRLGGHWAANVVADFRELAGLGESPPQRGHDVGDGGDCFDALHGDGACVESA